MSHPPSRDNDYPDKGDQKPKSSFPKPSFPKVVGRMRSLTSKPDLGVLPESSKPSISFTPNIPSKKPQFVPRPTKPPKKAFSVAKRPPKRPLNQNTSVKVKPDPLGSSMDIETGMPFMHEIPRFIREVKHKDIAPTSQSMGIDPLDSSHPFTLPFANPNAIEEDGIAMKPDQLFFIQLPSSLPITSPQMVVDDDEKKDSTSPLDPGFKNTLSQFPTSKIGKLQVYKSGKVTLKIGDISFHVSTGMSCNFLQEVAVISEKAGKYYQLGEITKRMVCYPKIG